MGNMKQAAPTKIRCLGIILMLVCAICLCVGQFVWKRYDGVLPMVAGFVIYGMGAIAMMTAYRFGSLSILQPINSVSYIISAVLGAIYFQETITLGRLVGILVIMTGVVFLTRGEQST